MVGKSRIGKSTFIRHLFAIDYRVLIAGAGERPVTQGIDMVIEPVNIDKNVRATILDCQGFDNQYDLKIER